MPERHIHLPVKDMPTAWYNIMADMPNPPAPYLHPATQEPLTPDVLTPIFPMALIEQEVSHGSAGSISPAKYSMCSANSAPRPLHRAVRLERALGTPARIYYKYEGVSPAGSHKPNTAIPQAWYNKQAGIKRLSTETGAGQWGCALSLACQWFGLECTVYMVKVSYHQKPYRKTMMRLWGSEVIASPSDRTNAGRAILAAHPDSLGSLGIAISEAVEDAASRADTNYSLGSVLNHVLMHQTIIGLEAIEQFDIGRRLSGCGDRLLRRRVELRRPCLPVHRAEIARRSEEGHALRRRRAGRLSHVDARRVSLRFRRRGANSPR